MLFTCHTLCAHMSPLFLRHLLCLTCYSCHSLMSMAFICSKLLPHHNLGKGEENISCVHLSSAFFTSWKRPLHVFFSPAPHRHVKKENSVCFTSWWVVVCVHHFPVHLLFTLFYTCTFSSHLSPHGSEYVYVAVHYYYHKQASWSWEEGGGGRGRWVGDTEKQAGTPGRSMLWRRDSLCSCLPLCAFSATIYACLFTHLISFFCLEHFTCVGASVACPPHTPACLPASFMFTLCMPPHLEKRSEREEELEHACVPHCCVAIISPSTM